MILSPIRNLLERNQVNGYMVSDTIHAMSIESGGCASAHQIADGFGCLDASGYWEKIKTSVGQPIRVYQVTQKCLESLCSMSRIVTRRLRRFLYV